MGDATSEERLLLRPSALEYALVGAMLIGLVALPFVIVTAVHRMETSVSQEVSGASKAIGNAAMAGVRDAVGRAARHACNSLRLPEAKRFTPERRQRLQGICRSTRVSPTTRSLP
jgi:hypothetical protein